MLSHSDMVFQSKFQRLNSQTFRHSINHNFPSEGKLRVAVAAKGASADVVCQYAVSIEKVIGNPVLNLAACPGHDGRPVDGIWADIGKIICPEVPQGAVLVRSDFNVDFGSKARGCGSQFLLAGVDQLYRASQLF
ncbi:hypothetical protein SDC9_92784 [bioreactor metagenome]|uniref:Uncharacterized protein n=1 Tax=bioreactor metagenome TaxID=1076179 RepID=A0A645A049_9ZZZZ